MNRKTKMKTKQKYTLFSKIYKMLRNEKKRRNYDDEDCDGYIKKKLFM